MKRAAEQVKGLGSLFDKSRPALSVRAGEGRGGEKIENLPLTILVPGKFQPRQHFDPSALDELADSIRRHDVQEPIIVRPITDTQFEIIAGERRWRASQLAGKQTIPALIRQMDDNQAAAIALIENIQRENLLPIEEARGAAQLIKAFEISNKEAADLLGKPASHITKLLKIVALPECLQSLHDRGTHALEPLSELVSAYKLAPERTIEFVADKEKITQREAREYHASLKATSVDNFGAEIHNGKASDNHSRQKPATVAQIVVVFGNREGKLNLKQVDPDPAYCWITLDEKNHRVKTSELVLQAVK